MLVNPDHLMREAYEKRTGDRAELTEAPPAVPAPAKPRAAPTRPRPTPAAAAAEPEKEAV